MRIVGNVYDILRSNIKNSNLITKIIGKHDSVIQVNAIKQIISLSMNAQMIRIRDIMK